MSEQKVIFLASLVHDIGALSENERLDVIETEPEFISVHAFNGAKLLEEFNPLHEEAKLIRYHHIPWEDGKGLSLEGNPVSLGSHVIHIADRACFKFTSDKNILSQLPRMLTTIEEGRGTLFDPTMVDALHELSKKEYIWLDLVSSAPVQKLPSDLFGYVHLEIEDVIDLSKVLSHIIDFRSKFTARHSSGVAKTAQKLAELIGFSELECKMMLIAGYLHDLGKLSIKDEILEKPIKLNEDEFNEIRSHTYYTYQLLDTIPEFETIKTWAAYHHERINGTGYPFRIQGDNLSLVSRIMAVADVFTAITENRPYRKGMSDESAISVLKSMVESGGIDRTIVDLLLNHYDDINSIREESQQMAAKMYDAFLYS